MGKTHSIRKEARQKPIPRGLPISIRRQHEKRARKKLNQGKGTSVGNIKNWM